MNILGLDTSSVNNFALGLYFDDKFLELNFNNFENTDEYLVYSIKSILDISRIDIKNIDYFACGIGPGSFTGLRIGLSIIKALSIASDKKIVPISSLELLSLSVDCEKDELIVPIIDARSGKVFTAIFKNGERLSLDMDIKLDELTNIINKNYNGFRIKLIGENIDKYSLEEIKADKVILNEVKIRGILIVKKAKKMIEDGFNLINSNELEPKYLRKSEAELKFLT